MQQKRNLFGIIRSPEAVLLTILPVLAVFEALNNILEVRLPTIALLFYVIGAVAIYLFLRANIVIYSLNELRGRIDKIENSAIALERHSEEVEKSSQILSENINTLRNATSFNGSFIQRGFIGLQNKAIEIESLPATEHSWRYSIHGHLPSFIRSEKLDLARGKRLYNGWRPERLINEYVDGINARFEAHQAYIESGGRCEDYFELGGIEKYLSGKTAFDDVVDPKEEIESRLKRLRDLNQLENYHLYFFRRSLGGSVLLRFEQEGAGAPLTSGSLLMDLRLPDSSTNFEKSCYGVFTTTPSVVDAYREKFESILASERKLADGRVISDQDEIQQMIGDWLLELSKR